MGGHNGKVPKRDKDIRNFSLSSKNTNTRTTKTDPGSKS